MAKAIPKISSRRNGRIGLRKGARRIPNGVIQGQASFNNTIVTVTDVRGRVVSWSSAGTSGFKGTGKDFSYRLYRKYLYTIIFKIYKCKTHRKNKLVFFRNSR